MDTLLKKYLPMRLPAYPLWMGMGMLLMAVEPIAWLVNTWVEPAHDSKGGWIFLLCAGLFVWSARSQKQAVTDNSHKKAVILLLITASIRGIGQVFAVNVLGALALAIDVYAFGLLAGLNDRKNPLSAGWLAILFAFSLPLERMLQRIIGFGLQHLSADGACTLLQGLFADVRCQGIRILLAGRDVLVDLPCSGVKSITLLFVLYAALMCVFRPTLLNSVVLGIVTLASALLANIIRISCLSIFIAYPEKIGGINVMAQPWHDLIGLFCLMFAAMPLALLNSRFCPTRPDGEGILKSAQHDRPESSQSGNTKTAAALGFLLLAAVIVSLPRQPLDVSDARTTLSLPVYLNGQYGQAVALSEQEQTYFTQFGGTAVKMRYGDASAMLIRTNSPLRHLHTPDDCLRGLGFEVQYQGVRYQPLATAIYLATAPDGAQWRVAVSFYSDQGQFTTNVSEVVWRWLQQPHSTWYALQRITPIYSPESKAYEWDTAIFAALDLMSPQSQENHHVKTH
ncbi:MAG: exosortase T [Methylobacter sp.]|nr:MAG: exosortase T [Methylobacter sp.]